MKSLGEIATFINGTVLGDPNIQISGIAPIEKAQSGEITFLANPKYLPELKRTGASAVIVSRKIDQAATALIQVDNPYLGFARVIDFLYPPPQPQTPTVDQRAVIAPDAELAADVHIDPYAYIGPRVKIAKGARIYPYVFIGPDCVIGAHSIIYPNVSIYAGSVIGERVTIHSGAVIGSDGFGYATDAGVHHKIRHIGHVVIEDDVEIGAGTTIDRAVLGTTLIGAGSKLDNQVQIGHNVTTGRGCLLVSQVGISGSSHLGDYVVLGGQAGVNGHIKVGNQVRVAAKAGVIKSVAAGETVAGIPALPMAMAKRATTSLWHVPEMRTRISQLEKLVAKLEQQLQEQGEIISELEQSRGER